MMVIMGALRFSISSTNNSYITNVADATWLFTNSLSAEIVNNYVSVLTTVIVV